MPRSYLLNIPEDLELKEEITYKVPKYVQYSSYINTMKTTFNFNFDFCPAFKHHVFNYT